MHLYWLSEVVNPVLHTCMLSLITTQTQIWAFKALSPLPVFMSLMKRWTKHVALFGVNTSSLNYTFTSRVCTCGLVVYFLQVLIPVCIFVPSENQPSVAITSLDQCFTCLLSQWLISSRYETQLVPLSDQHHDQVIKEHFSRGKLSYAEHKNRHPRFNLILKSEDQHILKKHCEKLAKY